MTVDEFDQLREMIMTYWPSMATFSAATWEAWFAQILREVPFEKAQRFVTNWFTTGLGPSDFAEKERLCADIRKHCLSEVTRANERRRIHNQATTNQDGQPRLFGDAIADRLEQCGVLAAFKKQQMLIEEAKRNGASREEALHFANVVKRGEWSTLC